MLSRRRRTFLRAAAVGGAGYVLGRRLGGVAGPDWHDSADSAASVPIRDLRRFGELVVAVFDGDWSADDAARALRQWATADRRIAVDAIGVLVSDGSGGVVPYLVGPHETQKGAGTGATLGAAAAWATGELPLLGGLAVGAMVGGLVGSLFHRRLDLRPAERARIAQAVHGRAAAVAVVAHRSQAVAVADRLASLGGNVIAPPQPRDSSRSDDATPLWAAQ
jgi:uncharacterized membrane protein